MGSSNGWGVRARAAGHAASIAVLALVAAAGCSGQPVGSTGSADRGHAEPELLTADAAPSCGTSPNEALQLSGGQFASVPPGPLLEPADVTLEAWVYLATLPPSTTTTAFVAKPLGTGYSDSYVIYLGSGGVFAAQIATDDSPAGNHFLPIPPTRMTPQAGQWFYVALTYDHLQGAIGLHVFDSAGGQAHATTQVGLNTPIAYDAQDGGVRHGLLIGADSDNLARWAFLDGIVDQVALWSTVRTGAQIARDRTACLPRSTASHASYWPFQGTYADVSGHGNDARPDHTDAGAPLFVVPTPNVPY